MTQGMIMKVFIVIIYFKALKTLWLSSLDIVYEGNCRLSYDKLV